MPTLAMAKELRLPLMSALTILYDGGRGDIMAIFVKDWRERFY